MSSGNDPEFGVEADFGVRVGVTQLWGLDSSSPIVANMRAVSLHRGMDDLQSFIRNKQRENEEAGRTEHTYIAIGAPMVAFMTGAAYDLLRNSNAAGITVPFEPETLDVIEGLIPLTTCN